MFRSRGRRAAEKYIWWEGPSPAESNLLHPGTMAFSTAGVVAWELLKTFRGQQDVEYALELLSDTHWRKKSFDNLKIEPRTRKQQKVWAETQARDFFPGANYVITGRNHPELRAWINPRGTRDRYDLSTRFRPLAHPINIQWLMRAIRQMRDEDAAPIMSARAAILQAAGEPLPTDPRHRGSLISSAHALHHRGKVAPFPTTTERTFALAWQKLYEALPLIAEWTAVRGARLGGMTWQDATKQSKAWHNKALRDAKNAAKTTLFEQHQRRMARTELIFADLGEDWKLWRLPYGEQAEFDFEGANLKHCIVGYVHSNSTLLSLRLKGEPKVTFELRSGRIAQAKSYRNCQGGAASWEKERKLEKIPEEDRTLADFQAAEIAPGVFSAMSRAFKLFTTKGLATSDSFGSGDLATWRRWVHFSKKELRTGQAARRGRRAVHPVEPYKAVHWTEQPGGLSFKDAKDLIETRGKKGKLSARPLTLVDKGDHIEVLISKAPSVLIYPKHWKIPLWGMVQYTVQLTPAKTGSMVRIDRGKPYNVPFVSRPLAAPRKHLFARAPGKVRGGRPGDWIVWSIPDRKDAPSMGRCQPYADVDKRGVVLKMYWECPEPAGLRNVAQYDDGDDNYEHYCPSCDKWCKDLASYVKHVKSCPKYQQALRESSPCYKCNRSAPCNCK